MASFTDAISQFNPYVQQLPIDAMVKVGTYKQQKYEEGVQKIQGQIDKVAGLDIYKDVDKQYLQSKLNQLGSKLKTVAAGDFSNFQLVNSVGGMATQIGKDEKVINSVNSTATFRKQIQKMNDDSEKTGGSNIYNRDVFLKDADNWINDKAVGSSFNYQYTPHRDVFKKLVEVGKSVGIDSTIVQQLFKTDAKGNQLYENGKLQYNDVMAETLLKGKDKGKLLEAFQAGLDAGDYKQLSINGRYELKGKTPEQLTGMLDETFNDYQKNIILQKEKINDKILEIKSSKESTTKEAKDALSQLQDRLVMLDESIIKKRQSVDQLKSADPDSIRSSIYTNNFLDSVADSLSEKETYTKYTKNPAVEILMDKERLKIAKSAESRQWKEFEYRKEYDAAKMSQDRWTELFKAGLVDEKGNPTGATLGAGAARDLPISDEQRKTYFTDKFEDGLNADVNAQIGLYEKVAVAHWLATNSGKIDPQTGKSFTEDGMKRQIKNQANKLGLSYNDYIVLQGKKASNTFNSSGNSLIGNEYTQDFKEISSLERVIANKAAKLKNADTYVATNAEGFKPFDLNKVNIEPMPISIDVPYIIGGKSGISKINETLSKKDLYHFALVVREGHTIGSKFASKDIREGAEYAKKELINKFGDVGFRTIKGHLTSKGGGGVLGIFSSAPIDKMYNLVSNEDFRKTTALKEQYFKGISDVSVPKGYTLFKDKPEQAKNLASKLASVASDYAGIDKEYENIAALATEEKAQFQVNVDPAVSRYDKNKYTLQVTKSTGELVSKPITQDQFKYLTGRNAPIVSVDDVSSSINAFGTGSTNSTYSYMDKDAHSTAYLKNDDFPNINRFRVSADFAPGAKGRYFPKLYINSGKDWDLVQYNPGPGFQGFTKDEVENFPMVVDDIFINSLLQRK
jgi:hypothetical protein